MCPKKRPKQQENKPTEKPNINKQNEGEQINKINPHRSLPESFLNGRESFTVRGKT